MSGWDMAAIGVVKVVFVGLGQECGHPWMCGPGCCGREVWMSPENVASGWSSWMSEWNCAWP